MEKICQDWSHSGKYLQGKGVLLENIFDFKVRHERRFLCCFKDYTYAAWLGFCFYNKALSFIFQAFQFRIQHLSVTLILNTVT